MKKYLLMPMMALASIVLFAQTPNSFNYQASVRNSSNQLVTNSKVGLRISIVQGSENGVSMYVETHTPTSNSNGLVNIQIGGGTVVSGVFSTINWANGPYFIKNEIDPLGGTNYTIVGTTQLLTVPYAKYAETSGSSLPGPKGDAGPKGDKGDTGAQGPAGKDAKTYTVGQVAQGGVIIYVDETGQHGLVASSENVVSGSGIGAKSSFTWNNGVNKTIGAGDGLYAGDMNTATSVSLMIGDNTTGLFAARVCYEYVVNQNGVEYGDWYLPSRYEMQLMSLQKGFFTNFSTTTTYWTSTETSNGVFIINLSTGTQQITSSKSQTLLVRAVRRF